MLSNMYRMYGSRAMQEQLPNDALITSKPVSQKHHRLGQRYPSVLPIALMMVRGLYAKVPLAIM